MQDNCLTTGCGCLGFGILLFSIIGLANGEVGGLGGLLLAALILGPLFGYIMYQCNREDRRREEEQRQREERRQAAIAHARIDPERFVVDSNVQAQTLAMAARTDDFNGWLAGLQSRIHYFEDKNDGAIGLLNEDIAAFEAMQQDAASNLLPTYDQLIRPYRDDLAALPSVQQSARLAVDYAAMQMPSTLDPAVFKQQTQKIWGQVGQSAGRALSSSTMSSGMAASAVGASILIGLIKAHRARVKQRTEFLKFQADVDVFGQETATTLQTCDALYRHIQDVQAMLDHGSRSVRERIARVQEILEQRASAGLPAESFFDFTAEEQAVLETLYFEGEQLRQMTAIRIL